MAERQGFEPWRRVNVYTLSRRAPSTTRPPLRTPQAAKGEQITDDGAGRKLVIAALDVRAHICGHNKGLQADVLLPQARCPADP